jgi:peptidoglycan hydrolase-like protein with peptidoglycan-binding domain
MTPQFKAAVETYGPRFMSDLGLTRLQVAGIFGNLAVESDQFRALQEFKPTVKGSRGGWGWAQWTGPRRRAFETWADASGYKRDDPSGFYAYMLVELRGSERAALARLKQTRTLDSAAEAFMKGYERPGVPHLQRRKDLALEALHVLEAKIGAVPAAQDAPAAAPAAPIERPRAETVQPAGAPATGFWSRLRALFHRPSDPARAVPVLAPTKGDPTIFGVQQQLRTKGYYVRGFVDGLDGPFTRDAVAGARKDMGLGDGGIDADFLAALPGLPQRPVSVDRATVGVAKAAAHVPAVFSPNFSLLKTGAALVAGGGAGSFFDTAGGLAQKASDTADRVSGYLDKAETYGGYLQTGIAFAVTHWQWFAIVGGVYLLFRALVGIADGVAKVRAAFF